ncbi:MAG TPA: type II/IV secretion system protein, partial [Firmicutes bacterium]|nr:type II/IV secretion system protein [Bacillota bacterium]
MSFHLKLKDEQGFTLLEIIAVFFLIALLYALVGSSVWNRLDQGRVKAT